ncbi:MAG: endonuclease III domain-containing protein [Anaerolineales bacterium]
MTETTPEPSKKKLALKVHRRLLEAYGEPTWRNPLPPVDELVSTILSQNTNDINRDRAFDSLRERFSAWEEVRDAPPEDVIEAIRIAGIANQKGPRIQAALQAITEEQGQIELDFLRDMPPEEVRAWLVKMKGVGPKTAAIVMQFSLDMPAFPVDTHIHRVSGRIGLRPEKAGREKTHEILADLFPPETYYPVHLNIIQHGRQICKALRPLCGQCVLADLCHYYQGLDRQRANKS